MTSQKDIISDLDDLTRINLLYDFYGNLLSERQNDVMRLYHVENFTLSEIAEEFKISRQGVHDALKNAEKSLYQYEEKLGLLSRFLETEAVIRLVDKNIEQLIRERSDDNKLIDHLLIIKNAIDDLDK